MSSQTPFGHHKTCISCHRADSIPGQSQCLKCRRASNKKYRDKKKMVEKKIDYEQFAVELLREINKLIADFLDSS